MEQKTESLQYFIDLIKYPVCICDGGHPQTDREDNVRKVFEDLGIHYEEALNLYDFPELYNLSKFKTLSFFTFEEFHNSKTRKVFDFDKSNLECVILQNKRAYQLCKDEAKKLDISIIGLDSAWYGIVNLDPPDKTFNHPFFLPQEGKDYKNNFPQDW